MGKIVYCVHVLFVKCLSFSLKIKPVTKLNYCVYNFICTVPPCKVHLCVFMFYPSHMYITFILRIILRMKYVIEFEHLVTNFLNTDCYFNFLLVIICICHCNFYAFFEKL